MNDTIYNIMILGLLILLIRLLYVVIFSKRKNNEVETSKPNEKESLLISGYMEHQSIPLKQSNKGSLSTVNTYLHSLEKSTPIYKVKASGSELLDREFNIGTNEERLASAKMYFKIVHQNFLNKQKRLGDLNEPIKNGLHLSLLCISTKDVESIEQVINAVNMD